MSSCELVLETAGRVPMLRTGYRFETVSDLKRLLNTINQKCWGNRSKSQYLFIRVKAGEPYDPDKVFPYFPLFLKTKDGRFAPNYDQIFPDGVLVDEFDSFVALIEKTGVPEGVSDFRRVL